MKKILLLASAMGFSMFGPMAAFRAPEWFSAGTASVPSPPPASVAAAPDPQNAPATPAPEKPVDAAPPQPVLLKPSLEGFPTFDFAEVFRFDVTPGWIMSRWSRVSAGLATLQLQGYRVPLVTGTAEDDLAGSLTYYFNSAQQVQRITFSGTTGDTRKLVHFIMGRYGFARRVTNDPSLFLYEIPEPRGLAKNILQIRPARVLTTGQPYQRFEVELAIERPADG